MRDTFDERVLVLSEDEAMEVVRQFELKRELSSRAVSASRAAQMLGTSVSTVRQLLDDGLLNHEVDVDVVGVEFVTVASIDVELARRQRRGRAKGSPLRA
jgi:hypothetical protein